MKRSIFTLLSFLTLGIFAIQAQTNTLTIPDVTLGAGKTISLPVNLDNTTDIVAVQFTLKVPAGLILNPDEARLTDRTDGMTVTMRRMATDTYMAMIYSASLEPVKGRTGTIMTVPLTADWLDDGSVLPLELSDVVIGQSDGANMATGFSAGTVKIATSADLEVSDVAAEPLTVLPSDRININWLVRNAGELVTGAGWSEQLYLDGKNGDSKLLATVYYEGILNPGATVSRNAEIVLPEILGIDGECGVRVKLVPNNSTGEPSWKLDNNTAQSTSKVNIGKVLALSPANVKVEEAITSPIRFHITRSGSTSLEETFAITTAGDNRLSVPAAVTIPKGQSGTYFYIPVVKNGVLDDADVLDFSVSGNGYNEVSATIDIEDDTFPELSIDADATSVVEGEKLRFVISAQRAPKEDLEIKINCDFASRFNIPAVVLPAGKTQVEFWVEAKDDAVPDLTQYVTFTVTAPGYSSAYELVDLIDNDVPTLQLILTPDAVSEAAGPLAVVATLKRTDNTDKKVTVKFSDDSNGAIYYGRQSVEMAAGVQEVTMNLGPIDNALVDGERTYNISAAVWIASCSCSAASGTSGGTVSAPLTVYDNDGAALALTASTSVVKEGDDIIITVSRNTDVAQPLEVAISSDHDSDLQYPSTVEIPAGKSTAQFTVKSLENDVNDDSFTAILTAMSEGFAKANIWFMVSDQTLPDAQISTIEVSDCEIEAGGTVSVTATLYNGGSYQLPEMTKVGFYLSGKSTPFATAYLQAPLMPGESVSFSKPAVMPDVVGKYRIYAVANDGQAVKELLFTNNTSNAVEVNVVSPFTFMLNTEREVYQQGETISITGKAGGKDVANKAVEVYVINDGYRHVINVETDASGAFATDYTPYPGQMGRFIAGACYPGEGLKEQLAIFDIYGLKRASNNYIKCKAVVREPFEDKIELFNPSSVDLTGVSVRVVSEPSDCEISVTCDNTIKSNSNAYISFTLTGKQVSAENKWYTIDLEVLSNETKSLPITLYYYIIDNAPNLKADISAINTTINKNQARDYQIILTNKGKGKTGKITLSLPSWITSVTPLEMPSLEQNDSTLVILRINPLGDMVRFGGSIGINCEYGDGISMPVTVTPVSDETGILRVDVCDEFTYYTSEAPHLKDADVVVRNYYTNEVVVRGKTDENGVLEVELPEGYYNLYVAAEKHDSYNATILIDPGVTNEKLINLSYQAVSVAWQVEETEIEDEYEIITTVKYETNVPAPVVILELPEKINYQSMAVGESMILQVVITNKGLITAKDAEVFLPTPTKDWRFDYLEPIAPFDLAPQQSVSIPVKFTRLENSSAQGPRKAPGDTYNACMANMEFQYYVICGKELKKNKGAAAMAVGICMLGEIYSNLGGGGGGSLPWMGGGGGPGDGGLNQPSTSPSRYTHDDYRNLPVTESNDGFCDPCQTQLAWKTVDCLLGFVPIWGCAKGIGDCATGAGSHGWRRGLGCVGTAVGCSAEICAAAGGVGVVGCTIIGWMANIGQCLMGFLEPCDAEEESANSPRRLVTVLNETDPSYIQEFQNKAQIPLQELRGMQGCVNEIIGDSGWEDITATDLSEMLLKISESDNEWFDADVWLQIKPETVSTDTFRRFIDRLNNTISREKGLSVSGDNYIDLEKFESFTEEINNAEYQSMFLGYDSTQEMWNDEYRIVKEKLNEKSNSVCASITLQFEQKMVLTRQAFRGTLSVYNGSENAAMENVILNLVVTDDAGNIATSHEFQINAESLEGFTGNLNFNDGWTLGAQETGVAKVLFIPTKYAAPTQEKIYYFGGTLTYVDPFTGLDVTRSLTPIALTVKPSPNLDLTYFMQRDIKGDDPLTEVVEPCEEAEFSLLINNIGYGDATNVRMVTQQPRIIENEKGLYIDFELISSQLNGKEKTLALGQSVATDFGTIPAKTTAYAQWWIKSSLLGHFTDYDVEATHVTSYDNPDLTLLNNVEIHELIRSLEVADGDNVLAGFMTNDIVDANDTPDMLYLSNGDIAPVAVAASARIEKISPSEYRLTVAAADDGWNYGNVIDPTYGVVNLKSVSRQNDGKELSLRNFWQTDRTLRDGKEPLYENRIHFADCFAASGQEVSYILTFEPSPALWLEVASIEGLPAEGSFATAPIESVNVMFNKYIDPATCTSDDLTLTVQGVKQDVSLIAITTENNKTFTLDLTELNKTAGNGYYVLTVQTAEITDVDGFNGKTGRSVGWNMYEDGMVLLNTFVEPVDGGIVTGARNVEYSQPFTLTAEPKDGYVFSHWTIDETDAGNEPNLTGIAAGDMMVTAHFIRKSYTVDIDSNTEGGVISGSSSGYYLYGEELTLKADADSDHKFGYWMVNGQKTEGAEVYTITVDADITVSAYFIEAKRYEKAVCLSKGWNWFSSNLADEDKTNPKILFSPISDKIEQVLGAEGELTNQNGLTGNLAELKASASYKVKVTDDVVLDMSGIVHRPDQTTIALEEGWNWIGYVPNVKMPVADAFVNLDAADGDVVKGLDSFAIYSDGAWIGSLSTLVPGEGYMYLSQRGNEFSYPAASSLSDTPYLLDDNEDAVVDWTCNPHTYPFNMTLIVRIHDADTEYPQDVFTLGAFNSDDVCVGLSSLIEDLHYITVHGSEPSLVSFKVFNSTNGIEKLSTESLDFGEVHVGTPSEPLVITVSESTGAGSILAEGDFRIYPNPVRETLYVQGAKGKIEAVSIISPNGATVVLPTRYDEICGMNVSHILPGYYIAGIKTADGIVYRRFIKR